MKVRDVFQSVRACPPDANLAEIGHLMWDADCGVIPMVDDAGKPVGIITDRDAFIALSTRNRPATDLKARDVACRDVVTCFADDDVGSVLAKMRTHRVRRLPVQDAEGRLIGILSINDLVLAAKPDRQGKPGEVTFADIALTFKAICAHSAPTGRSGGEAQLVGSGR
ncbi:MAG: CBS domain-containing protein [Planctomycetes bacterium]|nr:CBS domain-containing protein [Planctomycetota bacterium]